MIRELIIVRGLPGSGKTTLARRLGRAVCSADDWYMRNGIYKWSYRFIDIAHDWCQRKCRRFMQKGIERVIIANTHTTERSMRPYVEMANEYGYRVYTIIVENRHGMKSIHDVPEETMENMKSKFEIKL